MFSSKRTFLRELVRLLSGARSILDAGCGGLSPVRFVPGARLTGVDVFRSNIEYAKAHGTHDEYHLMDVRELASHFGPGQFDACAAVDMIEHFTKNQGRALLGDLERIARRKVVVFTPNGYCPQSSREEDDHQEHLSGWTPEEMKALGYQVIGSGGFRGLRGDSHALKHNPRAFWAFISWLSQHFWCRRHPESAAAILCWKEIKRDGQASDSKVPSVRRP